MLQWLGFGLGSFVGIAADYLVAGAMIAGGVYLAVLFDLAAANPLYWLLKPLRYVGVALAAGGLMVGAFSFGKTVAAADCIAAARLAAVQGELASVQRDLAAAEAAAAKRLEDAKALAAQKEDADAKIADWQAYASKLQAGAADCRRASPDDDRRLCAILGNAPRGCRAAR